VQIALRAVVPRGKLIDLEALDAGLQDALDHGVNIVRDDYLRTMRTWRRSAFFEVEYARVRARDLVASVTTDSAVYAYVDRGTEPHLIVPVRACLLRFLAKYRAKTRPGIMSSHLGGGSGPVGFARAVRHPGNAPRNFTATITRRRERNVRNLLWAAFLKSRGLCRSEPAGQAAAPFARRGKSPSHGVRRRHFRGPGRPRPGVRRASLASAERGFRTARAWPGPARGPRSARVTRT